MSGGARYINVTEGPRSLGGSVGGAVKLRYGWRMGAWADQNLGSVNVSDVTVRPGSGMFGGFAAWNYKYSGEGLGFRVSAATLGRNLMLSRPSVASAEAGSGDTQWQSQSVSAVANYTWRRRNNLDIVPYVGLRMTDTAMSSYTEKMDKPSADPVTAKGMGDHGWY